MEESIEKYYTYADILSWDEDVRAEIIDGELYIMSFPIADTPVYPNTIIPANW